MKIEILRGKRLIELSRNVISKRGKSMEVEKLGDEWVVKDGDYMIGGRFNNKYQAWEYIGKVVKSAESVIYEISVENIDGYWVSMGSVEPEGGTIIGDYDNELDALKRLNEITHGIIDAFETEGCEDVYQKEDKVADFITQLGTRWSEIRKLKKLNDK